MTDKYNYITKDQFVDLLVQVKKAQVGDLRVIMKSELKYPNETLPFEKIQVDLLFPGSYCMNSKGLSPGTSNLEGFTEYPYKDEAQRITTLKYLNKIKQKNIDTHNLKGQNRHKKALKDIAKKNQTYKEQKIELYKNPATPSLFLEYPVSLSLKNKSLPYKHIILLIDNEILYNLCLHDDKITERWNKTITEHYRSKKAKKYTSYLEPYYEWFEDREIVIDSNEYKDFPLLYDDRLEKGVDGKSNSYKTLVETDVSFPKVAEWCDLKVYFKKSDIRYIKFEYKPENYENDTIFTNELKAGDTKFTGSKGKNRPYKILESFILNERIERFDDDKEFSITKSVFNLNIFFKSNFHLNCNPITKDEDGIYGYISQINFKYI
ncbi:hypothetical protein EB821_05215 [Candidatus Marinimicrobia bacterium PRS2]|nr:hypothetical protein EB821_05215 [Candidatus Marinimicrobia bacterium PRS2]